MAVNIFMFTLYSKSFRYHFRRKTVFILLKIDIFSLVFIRLGFIIFASWTANIYSLSK